MSEWMPIESAPKEMTDAEVDAVMAAIYPPNRRWCSASCGLMPGEDPTPWACACVGCIYGALTWEQFSAWQERESKREPTPYIETPAPKALEQRLKEFKDRDR